MTSANMTCCFCLSDITKEQSSILLKCDHVFHSICLRQYQNNTCPLCRQKKQIKQEKTNYTQIKSYNSDQYVWLFGSFHRVDSTQERSNYIICNTGKKLISGYFWRLFDDEISKELEDHYVIYDNDKKNYQTQIEVGSMNYPIFYDSFTVEKNLFAIDPKIKICLQTSQGNRTRPILRIKWGDVIKYLLVVGIHDSTFFDKIYVYYDTNGKCLFFDMINQAKINTIYAEKKTDSKITVGDVVYVVDIDNNCIVDEKTKTTHLVEAYKRQNVVNM